MFDLIFEEVVRFLQNMAFLAEAWRATEVWTVGKVTTGLGVSVWLLGVILFTLWFLGKKIFKK